MSKRLFYRTKNSEPIGCAIAVIKFPGGYRPSTNDETLYALYETFENNGYKKTKDEAEQDLERFVKRHNLSEFPEDYILSWMR